MKIRHVLGGPGLTDPCPADLNCDGEVGVLDLLQLLAN